MSKDWDSFSAVLGNRFVCWEKLKTFKLFEIFSTFKYIFKEFHEFTFIAMIRIWEINILICHLKCDKNRLSKIRQSYQYHYLAFSLE